MVCVCTPISLPWLSVTLMDFDCGSRRSECERVTSSEHLHYEAGSNVDVHIIGPLLRSRTQYLECRRVLFCRWKLRIQTR